METAHSQDDVSQNFSAAAAGKCAQKSSQQRLQMVPELEQQSLWMGYLEPPRPGADLRGRRPAPSGTGSGSRGQRSLRPLLGGSQAVGQTGHAVRARQSSHPLIRLRCFQHPITGREQG